MVSSSAEFLVAQRYSDDFLQQSKDKKPLHSETESVNLGSITN